MSQSRPSVTELRQAFELFSSGLLPRSVPVPATYSYVISDLAGDVPDWVWDGMVIRENVRQPVIEYVISVEDEDVACWAAHLIR